MTDLSLEHLKEVLCVCVYIHECGCTLTAKKKKGTFVFLRYRQLKSRGRNIVLTNEPAVGTGEGLFQSCKSQISKQKELVLQRLAVICRKRKMCVMKEISGRFMREVLHSQQDQKNIIHIAKKKRNRRVFLMTKSLAPKMRKSFQN